jgi:hypothetical protein
MLESDHGKESWNARLISRQHSWVKITSHLDKSTPFCYANNFKLVLWSDYDLMTLRNEYGPSLAIALFRPISMQGNG